MGIFDKIFGKTKSAEELEIEEKQLNEGLDKTKQGFFYKISKAVAGKSTVDIEFLDELEEILISSDVGLSTTIKIIDRLEARVSKDKYLNSNELNRILKDEIGNILAENNTKDLLDFIPNTDKKPYVIMVVGVNGVGKTTTIGKLAYQLKKSGKEVLLGAGDTFRAAAVEQLNLWSERVGVQIVKQAMGSDPAAVAFDTVQSGVAKGVDVIILDTAGRLHNKQGLMDELSKIKKVMSKVIPDAPHEVLLVLDASTGQNALEQAKHFSAATQVTALALTKLDGTAKGGVVLSIADEFKIPIKYIGLGEKMEQLQVFNRQAFIETLFE
ncbi:MAG: signal recognition particle-docking protein FtsY [Chitinophagales bacterium]